MRGSGTHVEVAKKLLLDSRAHVNSFESPLSACDQCFSWKVESTSRKKLWFTPWSCKDISWNQFPFNLCFTRPTVTSLDGSPSERVIWFAQLVSQEIEETQETALYLLRSFLSEMADLLVRCWNRSFHSIHASSAIKLSWCGMRDAYWSDSEIERGSLDEFFFFLSRSATI